MNGYVGEERRQTTPIELRKVTNGAKYAMITAVISLVLMALAVGANLVVMARWTGRMETLLEVGIKDTAELKDDVNSNKSRIGTMEINDALLLQQLRDHRDRSE